MFSSHEIIGAAEWDALESVVTVLFDTLGLSSGRLDQPGREQHSVTVFKNDRLWNEQKHTFKSISFL